MLRRPFRPVSLVLAAALLLSLPGRALQPAPREAVPDVVDAPVLFESPLPATDPVDPDWFSDAVFIGDSRTEGLLLYSTLRAGLGLTHPGLNVNTARTKALFPLKDGKATLEEALSGGTWRKVYLMLGVNEASWMDEGTYYDGYAALIDQLRDLLPGAQIYVQTLIPVTAARSEVQGPDNARLARRNELLLRLAREKRVYLVDTAAAFAPPGEPLPEELSTDGLHFTKEGHHRWIDCLATHTVGL